MKKYIALTLIFTCLSVQAQSDETKLILKKFGMIIGGHELNKKCNILNEKKTKEFDRYFKKSSQHISDLLIVAPKETNDYARAIGQSSIKMIEDEKYSSCGKEAENLIEAAFETSKSWAK